MKAIIHSTMAQVLEITDTKGEEYCGGKEKDRLKNFKDSKDHPLKCLYVALDKHYRSFSTYVEELNLPENERRKMAEPIESRLNDIIMYAILAKCLIHDLSLDTINFSKVVPQDENKLSVYSLTKRIKRWAYRNLPERSIDTVIRKLLMSELPELMVSLGKRDFQGITQESCDVLILLMDLFDMMDEDMLQSVSDKQDINEGRSFNINSLGITQHIEKN